jgi:hypothetical protein
MKEAATRLTEREIAMLSERRTHLCGLSDIPFQNTPRNFPVYGWPFSPWRGPNFW